MDQHTVPTRWMTAAEAADYLRLSPKTLEKKRATGEGPPWHRSADGRTIRYDRDELDAFLRGEEVSR